MLVAGGIFKGNADVFARYTLFGRSGLRGRTRRIGAGKSLGIGALDLVSPSSAMFHNLVNNSAHLSLLTLVDVTSPPYLGILV